MKTLLEQDIKTLALTAASLMEFEFNELKDVLQFKRIVAETAMIANHIDKEINGRNEV